ncbi:VanZ family protein [Streptomyces sp. NPDC008121]|uniref:VanZ family protein n=1 Tax=Streptomyces sp. NPDC008121 TaxID=3364809 RepID=UPI0036E195FC
MRTRIGWRRATAEAPRQAALKPTTKPAEENSPAPTPKTGPGPFFRFVLTVLALAAMVAFAVVLARLTLQPSPASEALTHSNLRPGDSIRAYLSQPAFRDTLKQLGGNILLGVPFGLLLPVVSPRTRGFVRIALLTVATMLLVELVQGALITGRAFDIDDVLLNTAGALLGYALVGRRLGRAVHPRRKRHWWTPRRT